MVMSLSATYNNDFGRVQIAITGANVNADYAKVEHSLDQITWRTVRGGDTVPLSAGAGSIDHYDGYVFGSTNYYRVTAVDAGLLPTFIGVGTAATGNNTSLVPAHPASLVAGDLKLILASIRNSGTGTVGAAPAGWVKVAEFGNMALLGRIHVGGDTAPTVTFSGGAAGADTIAQMANFRDAKLIATDIQSLLNPSNQNVTFPTITLNGPGMILYLAWKQVGLTSTATPTFATKIADVSSAAGTGASMFWDFFSNPASNKGLPFGGDTVAVTGGSAAISRAITVQIPVTDFTDQGTTSTTPVMPSPNTKPYWLMNPSRPGQNVRVEITAMSEFASDGKTGVFEVLGRSYPVTVTDVMESGKFTFDIDAVNKTESKDLMGRLALGEPMYLLASNPADDMDSLYFTTLSVSRKSDTLRGSWTVTVSAREVAQPAPAVYGSTYTWADVVANYLTWTALVSDPQNTSWSNVTSRISTSVIVVP